MRLIEMNMKHIRAAGMACLVLLSASQRSAMCAGVNDVVRGQAREIRGSLKGLTESLYGALGLLAGNLTGASWNC